MEGKSEGMIMLAALMTSLRFFAGLSHIHSCLGLGEERLGTQPEGAVLLKVPYTIGSPPTEDSTKSRAILSLFPPLGSALQRRPPGGQERTHKRLERSGKKQQMLCEGRLGLFMTTHKTHSRGFQKCLRRISQRLETSGGKTMRCICRVQSTW